MTAPLTRAQAVTIALEEMERYGDKLMEHRLDAARGIADRFGLRKDTPTEPPTPLLRKHCCDLWDRGHRSGCPGAIPSTLPAPAHPLDSLGVGVFVRRLRDWPIEALARFDWACVPVLTSGRGAMNRDAGWWADAQAASVRLTAMDWLPPPGNFEAGLERAIDWSAEHGSLCWVVDAETPGPPRGWIGQPVQAHSYVAIARARCDASDCGLGFTGIAMLPRRAEWRAFIEGCGDLLVPQPYDRWGAYEAAYPGRVLDRWRELGARDERLYIGRGAFVDPDGRGPEHARWRTPQEIERHRATTPPGLAGECWWPPVGKMPSRVAGTILDGR